MIVYNLNETDPESIVNDLIHLCQTAAKSGVIHEKPVYVEFKKKMWIVTYTNKSGEFSELFKTHEVALDFMDVLIGSGQAETATIRGVLK